MLLNSGLFSGTGSARSPLKVELTSGIPFLPWAEIVSGAINSQYHTLNARGFMPAEDGTGARSVVWSCATRNGGIRRPRVEVPARWYVCRPRWALPSRCGRGGARLGPPRRYAVSGPPVRAQQRGGVQDGTP